MSRPVRKTIKGVPCANSASDHERGFLKALKNNLQFYGEQTDLERLLVVSGEAFRVVFADSWHIATSQCSPIDILGNACAAHGYDYEWFLGHKKEASWQKVKECIDEGTPAMSVGLADDELKGWSVVTGYEGDMDAALLAGHGNDGMQWCKVRGKGNSGYWVGDVPGKFTKESPHVSYDCPIFIVRRKGRQPELPELVENVAGLAIENASHPSIGIQYWGHMVFFFGTEALRLWAKALLMMDYEAEKEEMASVPHYGWGNFEEVMHVNLRLIGEGRHAGADFFGSLQDALPGKERFLQAAAAQYHQEAQLAAEVWRSFFTWTDGITPFDLEDKEVAYQFASRRFADGPTVERAAAKILSMREAELAAIENLSQLLPPQPQDFIRI